ncbi:MAG: hypothetical protein OXH86_04690 [Acidimicrobiaceae bacterium]|nr:hypothetical protein [Acidimicrobiaceae bacterium]
MENADDPTSGRPCCSSRQVLDSLFGESRLAQITYESIEEMCAGDLLCAATLGPDSAWWDDEGTIDGIGSAGMLAKLLVRKPGAMKPDGVDRLCRWLRALADRLEHQASGAADEDAARTREVVRDFFEHLDRNAAGR